MTDTATKERTVPRLKVRYHETLRDQLKSELELSNVMQVPRLEKVVINMGVGAATAQASLLEGAVRDLTTIAGQISQQQAVFSGGKDERATFRRFQSKATQNR